MPDPHGRVDLRSDTVTRRTPELRRATVDAEVGDEWPPCPGARQ